MVRTRRPGGARSPTVSQCILSHMHDNSELYSTILGVRPSWYVTDVELRTKQQDVTVMIKAHSRTQHAYPR